MQKFIKQNKLLSWVIGIGVIVALFLWLSPSDTDTATTHTVTVTTSNSIEASAVSVDDEDVHFPKYTGTSHDPFIPGVALNNPQPNGQGSLVGGKKWVLTGINSIDGVTSAVIENVETNALSGQDGSQSVFLKVGDTWDGMRVASITDDAINFVNAFGKVTQFGFPPPPAVPDAQANLNSNQFGGGGQGYGQYGGGQGYGQNGGGQGYGQNAGGQGYGQNGGNAPSLNQVNPLPALSPDNQQGNQSFGRRGRRQQ